MRAEDQRVEGDERRKRKRKSKTIACAVFLPMWCVYYGVFLWIVRTDYLTWIGITVGTILLTPSIFIAIAGIAQKERLEKRLFRISRYPGIAMLAVLGILVLRPDPSGPWRPYSFDAEVAAFEAERAVPDEENAALRYDAVLAAVDVNNRPESVSDVAFLLKRLSQEPWKAKDQPQVSAWLDSQTEIVTGLRQIGQMEKCRWPIYATADCEWTVPYKKLEYAAQLLALAGNRHLGEGRLDEAIRTSFCLLRHADHLYQQTNLLDYLSAFNSERTALQMIRYVLVREGASAVDLQAITGRLPGTENTWNQDITRLLRFDEIRFAQIVAPVYEFNSQGQIRFSTSAFPFLSKDESPREPHVLLGKWRQLYCHMNMPIDPGGVWVMAREESSKTARLLESGPVLPFSENDLFNGASFVDVATHLFANPTRFTARLLTFGVPTYVIFGRSYVEDLTHRRGTWLVLGLRRYRDDHGSWPESLDAISEYVPPDAFLDPAGGDRFVYALDGDGFRLYSTGRDLIDDGGRCGYLDTEDRPQDDIAIWPPRKLEHPKPRSQHEIEEELKAIYGENYVRRIQTDANAPD